MAVVLDVLKRALRMNGVIAEGETPGAAQADDALITFNGMLAGWEGVGIRLGVPQLALTDTIPLPPSHDDAITYNLALALATEYGNDLRPAVVAKADEGMTALRSMYSVPPVMLMPPELWARIRVYRRW